MRRKVKNYTTVGVRFLFGPRLEKVYSYMIRKKARVHLGMEVIVPTPHGNSVAVIVEIHKNPDECGTKWVKGRIARL